MKYILSIISIILLFTAVSCEVDLEVPVPPHEAKITVNTFLSPDREVILYVTRSFGIQEKDINDSTIQIRDAQVALFKDGVFLDSMEYVDTIFVDTLLLQVTQADTTFFAEFPIEWPGAAYFPKTPVESPKPGETYTFRVTHPDYDAVEASTTIPSAVQIQNVELVIDSLSNTDLGGFISTWSALNLEFNDPAGEENYYRFYYSAFYTDEFVPGQVDTVGQSSQLAVGLQRDTDGFLFSIRDPLSDVAFDGQSPVEVTTWFQLVGSEFTPSGRPIFPDVFQIKVDLFAMDKQYAVFTEKLLLQSTSYTTGIESAFFPSEPVILNSNVEGGYGLVGSFNNTDFIFVR